MFEGNDDPAVTPDPQDDAAQGDDENKDDDRNLDPGLPPDPTPPGEPDVVTKDELDEITLPDGTRVVAEPPKPEEDEIVAGDEGGEGDDDDKTRKENRAERIDKTGTRFIDRVKREAIAQGAPIPTKEPEYNPLDFRDGDKYIKEVPKTVTHEDGSSEVVMEKVVDTEALEADRKAGIEAAEARAAQRTAEQLSAQSEQQRFFDEVSMDSKLLVAEKDFEFLKDPDDERAQYYNEQFALATGYKAVPVRDAEGRMVVDPNTGQPQVREYVTNPGISYANFVRGMKEQEDKIIEKRLATSRDNKQSIADKSGIKPGGEAKKTTRLPNLEDVHRLKDDDWEKTKPLLEAAYGVKRPG